MKDHGRPKNGLVLVWQVLFLITGSLWLFAPALNHILSSRFAYISQFESNGQPYQALFRLGDFIAALLLFHAAVYIFKNRQLRVPGILLLLISVGMAVDALFTNGCAPAGIANLCADVPTASAAIHETESVITFLLITSMALQDSVRRRRVASFGAIIAQIFMAAYSIWNIHLNHSSYAGNTAVQFTYQTIVLLWIAWLVRDLLVPTGMQFSSRHIAIARKTLGSILYAIAFIMLVVGMTHFKFFGEIYEDYFPFGTWISQHSVVSGVILLYMSRHLSRGEMRARQLTLVLLSLEILRYSVVAANPALLIMFCLYFIALFVLRDAFLRGTVTTSYHLKLKETAELLGSLLLVAGLIGIVFAIRPGLQHILLQTTDRFADYVFLDVPGGHTIRNQALARAITAFLTTAGLVVLWSLFRPVRRPAAAGYDHDATRLLHKYGSSSEDFFKLWPLDKEYFYNDNKTGFIAYKQVGSVAYALANPVASRPSSLLQQFNEFCEAHRLTPCFLLVSENHYKLYQKNDYRLLKIGSSALVSIERFSNNTRHNKWWRWQHNRALRQGFTFHTSNPPHDPQLLAQLQTLSNQWLTVGGHKEQSFALGYYDDDYLNKCNLYYLITAEGHVVAFANLLPQFNGSETATVDLIRYAPGFPGAMPTLLDFIIVEIHDAFPELRYFDLGFVPLARTKGVIASIIKALGRRRFSAHGLEQFKNKFEPKWQTNYLAYKGDTGDLGAIAVNLERALAAPPHQIKKT